jgi:DNA-binding NtrC family response regulator
MSEVRAGNFREDVYWRLNVVPVEIPPLRDRREDIPQLLTFFLKQYNEVNDRYVVHIQPAVIEALQQYTWPGNVRELQNYVERAVVLANGDEFTTDLLPPSVLSNQPEQLSEDGEAAEDLATLSFRTVQQGLRELADKDGNLHSEIVDRIERELIQQVLAACGGTRTKAAIQLGINRNTLHKKIKDLRIDE